MRILVIGGTGAAGSRIAAEARRRGHVVTVASRNPAVERERVALGDRRDPFDAGSPRAGHAPTGSVRVDAADPEAVAAYAVEADVLLSATRPAIGTEEDVSAVTRALAFAAAAADTRLLVVGGAAPLRSPATGQTVLDDPQWVPTAIRPFAAASTRQLAILREAPAEVAWTYLAPAADFAPREARGTYRHDAGSRSVPDLVIGADGTSRISMEDFALAACDEAEHARVRRGVIAVGW
ncbi:NAD(P)-dependent oxidoreductase [Brachybacterium sp. GCM10030267]|uniref:NAD(P)-dependent oxidoreductase n=1 Tax=unclassified Brachybacterium TaxID=2623841 RepID=UPI00360B2E76